MFLRRKSEGYRPNKAKIVTKEKVTKFHLEADNTFGVHSLGFINDPAIIHLLRNSKCVKQVVSFNTIEVVLKKVDTFLKLENLELYTGRSFRRSAATMLVVNGGDMLSVKEIENHLR